MTIKQITRVTRTTLLGLLALACWGPMTHAAPKTPSKKGFCVVARPDGKWKQQVTALNAR